MRPLRRPLHRHFLVLERLPRGEEEKENFLDNTMIKQRITTENGGNLQHSVDKSDNFCKRKIEAAAIQLINSKLAPSIPGCGDQ